MYAWIWRKLPFGVPGKLLGSVMLATATVALLWYVIFPWAEPLLPFDDVQVEQPTGDTGGPAGGNPDLPGEDAPAGDDHDLPYDTEQNNTPPSPDR
ncbi:MULTISPECIES: hypothetical protein [Micromonospora]|uniref:Uncharacterized protein n=1 Tax=Micromonospora yangpuensis TaxID=683228 RepID=A0A1C6TX24_9ACTN|nr:hypothetical protein [Micromonospora yangpuensis]GGM01815.1 hypothetical protein GCM10012279_19330 [Micromonospora yangpuensis]SCL46356.1 hypothetical protein GA0070617_0237 [Micromonospora yangpuensis]